MTDLQTEFFNDSIELAVYKQNFNPKSFCKKMAVHLAKCIDFGLYHRSSHFLTFLERCKTEKLFLNVEQHYDTKFCIFQSRIQYRQGRHIHSKSLLEKHFKLAKNDELDSFSPENKCLLAIEFLKVSNNSGLSTPEEMRQCIEMVIENTKKTTDFDTASKLKSFHLCAQYSSSRLDAILDHVETDCFQKTLGFVDMKDSEGHSIKIPDKGREKWRFEDKQNERLLSQTYKEFFIMSMETWLSMLELGGASDLQIDTAIFTILKFVQPKQKWAMKKFDTSMLESFSERLLSINPEYTVRAINQLVAYIPNLSKKMSNNLSETESEDVDSDVNTEGIDGVTDTKMYKILLKLFTDLVMNICKNNLQTAFSNSQLWFYLNKYAVSRKKFQNPLITDKPIVLVSEFAVLWNTLCKENQEGLSLITRWFSGIEELKNLIQQDRQFDLKKCTKKAGKRGIYTINPVILATARRRLEPISTLIGKRIGNHKRIVKVSEEFRKLDGQSAPMIFEFHFCDGTTGKVIMKINDDDFRLDMTVSQFSENFHRTLQVKTSMRLQTYNILPIEEFPIPRGKFVRTGLLEFSQDTMSLQEAIDEAVARYDGPNMVKMRRDYHEKYQKYDKLEDQEVKQKQFYKIFQETLKKYPMTFLDKWFLIKFKTPESWYNATKNYARSLASTGITGYLLGLQDRHLNNVRINIKTGDLVNIDFGDAFEGTIHKPTPERVPFRLTRNMIAALGTNGIEGRFRSNLENALLLGRQRSFVRSGKEILSIMFNDKSMLHSDDLVKFIEKRLDERFRGVDDPVSIGQNSSELSKFAEQDDLKDLYGEVPVRTHANAIIARAVDPRNHARMFPGWSSFI